MLTVSSILPYQVWLPLLDTDLLDTDCVTQCSQSQPFIDSYLYLKTAPSYLLCQVLTPCIWVSSREGHKSGVIKIENVLDELNTCQSLSF